MYVYSRTNSRSKPTQMHNVLCRMQVCQADVELKFYILMLYVTYNVNKR